MKTQELLSPDAHVILDCLNDGVYVTDTDRRIVFWNRSAERITGWKAEDIVGHRCCDNILCHIDKDGHRLCGEEYCPLYRAMLTGAQSTVPIILFAQSPEGHRIPMQVSVSPLRDDEGNVVGAVEAFRDLSHLMPDLDRAKRIQERALKSDLPEDPRIRFNVLYVPVHIIGGDYYAFEQQTPDTYAFMLADVMGHGISAALYTMHLHALWEDHRHLLPWPAEFLSAVNNQLCTLIGEETAFAACLCGHFDVAARALTFASAGNPLPLMVRHGVFSDAESPCGLPLGLVREGIYVEGRIPAQRGDAFLFFTDGATDITDRQGRQLGREGLTALLRELGYPGAAITAARIEAALLKYSGDIRLPDDLALLDVRLY